MRYAGLIENDIINGQGVCVSVWFQGCPHRCPGCHNPETWDFEGGKTIEGDELIGRILAAIGANGIQRNLSLLGGEPFCDENIEYAYYIVLAAKKAYPNIKIFGWTGSWYEDLLKKSNPFYKKTLAMIDVLVAGPYIQAERNITLPLRGSNNQIIHNLREMREKE